MNALLIFIKNPQLGRVKTRLAATVGNQKALEIYEHLLQHTRQVATDVTATRFLYYSDFVDETDAWPSASFKKLVQYKSDDLGVRMFEAFQVAAHHGAEKIIIIGSDCLALTPEIIATGFNELADYQAVIGRATDGGYYAIGLNLKQIAEPTEVLESLFLHKTWSHENVAAVAVASLQACQISVAELPILSDVDVAADVPQLLH